MAVFRAVTGSARDHLLFDSATLRGRLLDPSRPVPRLRIKQLARLVKATIPVEVEVTFGEPGTAGLLPDLVPELTDLPTLADAPTAALPVARFETIAAECLVEIVKRPRVSRRMADYFDLWMCMQVDPLDALEEAVRASFAARGVEMPDEGLDGLWDEYAASEHAKGLWASFVERGEPGAAFELEEVVEEIRKRVASMLEGGNFAETGRAAPIPRVI